ncbi:uncharacterized protein LOC104891372 [Beta vulgaris subsp. vulgaris]|uniref:uncharacterized protein LOC104891372 n=1 Tax=Beta vulgaris subsp. vulgaris TaxID=3555 RepID=UPI00053FDB78|nr:uncharacterized protein LOC104891372 [Beta vulgaris subsp. vulgaris]
MENWNKADMLKLLWAITFKTDNLWVKWITAYYLRKNDIYSVVINNNMSWHMRKILKSREILGQVGNWENVMYQGKFSIKKSYKLLQGEMQKVNWRRLICNNRASPKSKFIVRLAVQNRLYTTDRISKWNVACQLQCSLCTNCNESTQHLFFEYSYYAEVWMGLLQYIGIYRTAGPFDMECRLVCSIAHSNSVRAKIYVMMFSEAIHTICCQRNNVIFANSYCLPLFRLNKCYSKLLVTVMRLRGRF